MKKTVNIKKNRFFKYKIILLLLSIVLTFALLFAANCSTSSSTLAVAFKVTDAYQKLCYDNNGVEITCPGSGETLYGQDAQYSVSAASYAYYDVLTQAVVIDLVTGLMWEKAHHSTRVSYTTANTYCENLELEGFRDWRIPSIRELFSISTAYGDQNTNKAFYLDSNYFDLDYPNSSTELTGSHTVQMMGQTWSSTSRPDYSTINYFFNFLDGHIKSNFNNTENATMFYRCVRGDASVFAANSYTDNGNSTVTDNNTGLIWQQANGEESTGDYQFSWENALAYCEALTLGGSSDWRLPDIKELQSIVYYDNPNYATSKMVLDTSVFTFTLPTGKNLTDNPTTSPPDGNSVAPFFWSSTTHGDANTFASYICFGPCWAVESFASIGYDAHGPGAQRSDPKINASLPTSIGDQKDVVQADNFVRCVR
ncbi:MAG: DUF1566 domain-containing protein [bacterium]|nr:DUF1566 domain-containing protein [bacterium]